MKHFLIILLALFFTVSSSIGAAYQPIGNSLIKTATVGLLVTDFDYMQRTEDLLKLKKEVAIGLDRNYWGNYLQFGVSYKLNNNLVPVFLFSFSPSISSSSYSLTQEGVNQTTSTTNQTYDPNSKTDNSDLTIGSALGLNLAGLKLGIMYAITVDNTYSEWNKTDNNIFKTNDTTKYKISDIENNTISDTGTTTHLIEIGGAIGSLTPQLQVRLKFNNGDNENNYSLSKTTTYRQDESTNTIKSVSETHITGIANLSDAAALSTGYNNIKNTEIQFAPDVKVSLSKTVALYLGGEFDIRSIDSDNAKYESKTINISYYTNGANTGKMETYNETIDNYSYTQDTYTAFEVFLAIKYKKAILKDVVFGIYPKYDLKYKKAGYTANYERTQILKNDSNANGTFEASEITTTVKSGNADKFETTTWTHQLSLPLAFNWSISSVFSIRLGSKVVLQYSDETKNSSDTDGFTTQTQTTGTTTSTATLATSTSTSTETTTDFNISSKNIYLGFGIKIVDNMILDLYASAGNTVLNINQYSAQLTYKF